MKRCTHTKSIQKMAYELFISGGDVNHLFRREIKENHISVVIILCEWHLFSSRLSLFIWPNHC